MVRIAVNMNKNHHLPIAKISRCFLPSHTTTSTGWMKDTKEGINVNAPQIWARLSDRWAVEFRKKWSYLGVEPILQNRRSLTNRDLARLDKIVQLVECGINRSLRLNFFFPPARPNVEIDTKGIQCSRLRKSELCSSQVFWSEVRERAWARLEWKTIQSPKVKIPIWVCSQGDTRRGGSTEGLNPDLVIRKRSYDLVENCDFAAY